VLLAGLLLAASAAACDSSSGADRGGAGNTVATEPAPTSTTKPNAVPAVVDAAYVNRVLSELDQAMGDVIRLVVSAKTITPEAYDRLRALYSSPDHLQLAIDAFQLDMRRGFAGYKPVPGNKRTLVTQLISGSSACIFARVSRDYSAVSLNASTPVDDQWMGLRPLDPARDPNRYNSSQWSIVYEGFPRDRSQPPNPCAS
jgi:hypothetical protein